MRNADQLGGIMTMWKQYGDIVFTKFGPIHNYMLFSPEYVHHVMVTHQKNYIKGIGYDGLRKLVGQGLITSDGDYWKQHRRMLGPHFTPAAVQDYSGMMAGTIAHMLARWEKTGQQAGPLHMGDEMLRLTMSIIGRAMFSFDLGEEPTEVGRALQEAFTFIPASSFDPPAPISFLLPAHRRFKRNLKVIDRFIYDQIAKGRREGEREDLLSVMLNARDEETGRGMSDRQLRDEAITLFFAGFETTARSLTWGWYLLSRNPEVMEALVAESDAVLGGRLPAAGDLERLTYARMVVDETLRLYPPTAVLARQNVEPDEIGGYSIPRMSLVTLAPYVVHRYPAYWPDAERFDPQRFTPEASAARPKFAYIPFAAGPRVCLGNSFALMEMVFAFAMAAGRFRFERATDEIVPATFAGTIRPAKPLHLKVSPRS
jgi:cytochrome P450